MKLKIPQQGTKPEPHVEIGVQIELVTGKDALFGARSAADAAIALEHGDAHAGAREISGERQTIVTSPDHHAIEIRHVAPRLADFSRWIRILPQARA